MVTEVRQPTDNVIAQLMARPYRFDFFQAIHLLEQHLSQVPDWRGEPSTLDELLQIRPSTSLAFPSSDLDALEVLPPLDVDDERERYRLTVNFFGLYGVDSPLPDFYSERFLHDEDQESPQRHFVDVFHHRLYALLYRCWKKYRYYMEYQADGRDVFSRRALALIGLPGDNAADLPFAPTRLLTLLGGLSRQECSAPMLRKILCSMLRLDVRIEQFVLGHMDIPEDQQCRLGRRASTLGRDLSLGSTVADRGAGLRLHIRDLTRRQFESLQAGGERRRMLASLMERVLSRPLDYELQLRLRHADEQSTLLGGAGAGQLGRDSWLASRAGTVGARFAGEYRW